MAVWSYHRDDLSDVELCFISHCHSSSINTMLAFPTSEETTIHNKIATVDDHGKLIVWSHDKKRRSSYSSKSQPTEELNLGEEKTIACQTVMSCAQGLITCVLFASIVVQRELLLVTVKGF